MSTSAHHSTTGQEPAPTPGEPAVQGQLDAPASGHPAAPPAPNDGEQRRLAALRRLGLLDTPPEPRFDDLARLASELCAAPIALLSLVDADRLWFKARVGLDAAETPRAGALCAQAILQPATTTVVTDALADERFRAGALVAGPPHVRFYAGAPLVTGDGAALGTLCVYDTAPRALTEGQRAGLEALARAAAAELERRRQALGAAAGQRLVGQLLQAVAGATEAETIAGRAAQAIIQSGLWARAQIAMAGAAAEQARGGDLAVPLAVDGASLGTLHLGGPAGLGPDERAALAELAAQLIAVALDGAQRHALLRRELAERARDEAELWSALEFFEGAEQQVVLGTWSFDVQSGGGWWSRQMYVLFDRDPAAGVPGADEYLAQIHPEDRPMLAETLAQMARGVLPEPREFRVVVGDGSVRVLSPQYRARRDSHGAVTQFTGTVLDITERQRVERALRVVSERFLQITEHIQEVFWMVDSRRRRAIYISPNYELIWGRTVESFYADQRSYIEAILPEDRPIMLAALERQAAGFATSMEYRIVQPGGAIRWIYDRSFPVFGPSGALVQTIGVAADITERKLAQEQVAYSASLIEHVADAVISTDLDFTIRSWNRAAAAIYGWDAEEVIGRTMAEVVPIASVGADLAQVTQQFQAEGFWQGEAIHRRKDGTSVSILSAVSLVRNKVGAPVAVVAVNRDISDRKRAELALRASEERYRGLMQSLDSLIAILDGEGRFLYMNEVAARMLGGTPAALAGKTLHELFPEPFASQHLRDVRRVIREDAGLVVEAISFFQGAQRWYRLSVQPIHDEGSRVAYALLNATDIDDLKTTQQQLIDLNHTLEQRVKERAAEVQDLYEYAPTGYHSVDAAGRVVRINAVELAWLGYTRDEVLGRPLTEFISARGALTFEESLATLKQRGWVRDVEYEFVRKDGSSFPAVVSATAVFDEAGSFVMSRTTVFDNTERKKAEDALRESEEHNRLLFEEAPEALILLDDGGRIVRLNRAFERLTGYGGERLAGRTAGELAPLLGGQLRALGNAARKTSGSDSVASAEFTLRRADGEARVVGARVFAIVLGGRQHFLSTLRDITAYRQAERGLRVANTEMERALRLKDEFLANMSHELRTPLNAILGLGEILLEEVRGPLNGRQKEALHGIEASGRHLLSLINDVLDVSKVEAGHLELELEPVVVVEVCQASLHLVRELAVKKGLTLSFKLSDAAAQLQADQKRLKQMLVNLLSNAVKFTPSGGAVSLEVTVHPDTSKVRFVVQDTGIGIAPEDIPRLFRPFEQLDSSLSRQHEGTGLGLVLVRRMAELHGGTVLVASEPGKGSRFTIVLPYRRPSGDGAAAARPEPPGEPADAHCPSSLRILLAEDNAINGEAIGEYLRAKGCEVLLARTGREAVERAREARPDLILMDIQMPEMDGLQAIRILRARPEHAATPIVALTALAMPGDRERCLAAGATEYMTKPVGMRSLMETIRRLHGAPGPDAPRR